jgi:hypothetical protein
MRRKERVKSNGDDWDFFTGWRRYRFCDYGRSRRAKNSYNRRCRKAAKRFTTEYEGGEEWEN